MVYEPPVEQPVWTKWAFSYRALAYAILMFLIFALTVSALGLVSFELHRYGNTYEHYPSREYKHTLGILLFVSISTLLFSLGHFWASISYVPLISLILAVFWGVGAGLLATITPFRGTHCHRQPFQYSPPQWGPYAKECKRVISLEGIAWAEWVLFIFLLIGSLAQKFSVKARPTPEEMYFASEPQKVTHK